MKKNRVIALVLTMALVCGAAGVSAFAAQKSGAEQKPSPQSQTAAVSSGSTAAKTEAVYVLAGANGSTRNIIVSDQFENASQQEIADAVGQLSDAENVKADNCWMGTTQQTLPVELKVSYTLDGRAVTPEELAGKSGRVSIRFDYENTQAQTVELDGRQQTLYVPFAVLTGAVLDSDCFSNVTVTNGRQVCDGDHIAIVGMAFPGLQENLALEKKTLEIPSFVELQADVENFSLETTYTLVTNSPFTSFDAENLEELDADALSGSLGQLTDAMGQLMDGSSELCDGLETLLASSGELSDGVSQLAGGLSALTSHNQELNGGAQQVFASLLSMADTQLAAAGLEVPKLTIDNYAGVLNGVLKKLDSAGTYAEETARQQVRQSVLAQKDEIRAGVTQAVRQEVTNQVTQAVRQSVWQQLLAAQGLDEKSYEAGAASGALTQAQQTQLQAALDRQMASDGVKATIAQTVEEKMASSEVQATIDAKTDEQVELLVEQNMASPEVQEKISAATAQASSGAASLRALKQQLDSYNTFYQGLSSYTAGVASASSGAATLNANMPALVDGVTQLRDGAKQLSDGLEAFNRQGIEKLLDVLDADVGGLAQRLEKTVELAKTYSSFTDNAQGLDSSVKFIYRTEAIEAP